MAFRHLKVLARTAGDVVRAGRGERIVAPWRLKRALALEEGRIATPLLNNGRLHGRSSPLHEVGHCRITVRGAANDALDIVRYLEGAENENDESADFERFRGPNGDSGADEVEVGRFSDSDGDFGADGVIENAEEFGSFSGSDGDSGADEVVDNVEEFGRFRVSDGDSGADEVAENVEEFVRFSDSDADSGGDEVVDNVEEFKRFSDSDADSGDQWDKISISRLKPHADGMYRKIIDSIANPESLAAAFETIKKIYGKIIFRSHETIDWRWCEQTAGELRAGTYTFRPVRLLNVPVLGQTDKLRSIRVVSPKDQIVLETFRATLEKIYTPVRSSPHVHNSKHTALSQVKYGWRGTSWFMEFGIKRSYDETNQKRLKNILSERIQDKRFLDTLFQMFNAGVIGLERTNIEEGGILSTLLCNIYYHKLDEEVEAIMHEWNSKAKHRSVDPAYRRLMVGRLGGDAEQTPREKLKKLATLNYKDPNFTRVQYVRFGDEFLVGLSGPKSTATKIMRRLTTFLQSNLQLELDPQNTRLGHAVSDKTLFLGALIRVLDPKELPKVSSSLTRALVRKRAQTMRVKQQLEDRWTRECRNVVLKCWTVAFEKWRRELGKDGAKRKTFEAATQQLLSLPEEEGLLWREKAQDVLGVFISAALRQGLFPKEEVDGYYKVLASLEKSLAKEPQHDFEDLDV